MATVFRKAKLSVEDIHFDDEGTGSTVQTPKSDGTYRTVRRLNATHIPTTTAIRTLSATAINVCQAIIELWALVLARLPKAGGTMTGAIAMGANKITGLAAGTNAGDALRFEQVDGTTIVNTGAVLGVKALGIDTGQLKDNAVTSAKILAAQVTTAKIAALNVTAAEIANATITPAKLTWVPTMYVWKAGVSAACNPGATTYALAVASILATDSAQVVIASSTASVSVNKAICVAGFINLTFSADPGAGTTFNYAVFRAIP